MSSSGGRGTYSILIHLDANQANSVLNQFKTNVGTLTSTIQTSAGAINTSAMSFDRIGTSSSSAQMSVQKLVGVAGPLSNSLSGAAAGSTRLTGSLANLNGRITGVVGGLGRANTLVTQGAGNMGKLAVETEKASKSSLNMASNLRGMIIPIVGMGSAIVEAVGMFQAFQDTSRNVDDAQRKLNDTIKKYGEGSKEARDAIQQLEAAQRGLQFILRNTIQSISDIGIFAALMANSFLKMRTSATALNPVLGATTAMNTGVATSMGTVTATTNTAGGALTRFTGILRAIPLVLGPIGIAFLAIGGAIATFTALYSQNIAGLRDSTNDFGAAVGEAIPILRPFGDLLVGIGGQLGITGESAERTAEHMRNATTGFHQMGTLWEQTLDNISNGFMEWGFNVQQGFGLVVDSFSNFFSQIGNQLGQWLGEFGARLQSGFDNVFGHLLGQATDIAQGIANELNNFGQWLNETSVDILASIGIDRNQLVSQAELVGKSIGEGILRGFGAVGQLATQGLKESQELGASGNIPGTGESFASQFVKDLLGGSVGPPPPPTSGGIKPDLKQSGQTWEDIVAASRPTIVPPTAAPGQSLTSLPGVSVLDLSKAAPMTELFRKQSAVNTIIANQLKDQKTAATQASEAYGFLTDSYDMNTFAALDLKDAEKLLNDEGITVGVGALENLEAAQKAVIEGRQKAKTDDEILTDVERALNGEMEVGSKKIEDRDTVIQKLRQSNDDLVLSLDDTATAIKDQSLMQELSKQGTLEAQQAIVDYGSELLKNTSFNKEWGAALDSAVFKQAAFRTGVQEQVAALNESKVAILEGAGSLAEYVTQIESGEMLQVAFTRGVQEQSRALYEDIEALAETEGSLQTYVEQLEKGEIQSLEFVRGQQEVRQLMADMVAESANLEGQMLAYNEVIKSSELAQTSFNLGLREGGVQVQQWFQQLVQGEGTLLGMQRGLQSLADHFGIRLPESVKQSTEPTQEFMSIMLGAPSAIAAFDQRLTEAARTMTEGFANALREGKGEFKDAIKELEESLDINIPKEIEKSFKIDAKLEIEQQELQGQVNLISNIIAGGLNKLELEGWPKLKDEIIDNLTDAIDDAEGPAKAQLQRIRTLFVELFNIEDVDSTQFKQKLAEIEAEINGLENRVSTADPLSTFKGNLDITEQVTTFSNGVDTIIGKITQLNQIKGPEMDLEGELPGTVQGGISPGVSTGVEVPISLSQPAPTIDTTPSKQAMDELLTYATNIMNQIAQMGQHVSTMWNGHFNTAAQNAMGHMNILIAHAIAVMNQVAETASYVAISWTTHFNTATQNAAGVLNQLIAHAINVMNQVAQKAQFVAVSFTTHFNTAAQNAAGSLNQLLTHAQTQMAAIAATAQQVAVAFTQQFEQGAQNAAGSINNLTSHIQGQVSTMVSHLGQVTQAFNDIAAAANDAAGEVDALRQAVESVPTEHTITFNVVVTGDSIPSGGTLSAAGGLGYHKGVAYLPMASGSGISGAGFDPVMIDHPTNILVGESGPELVSVTPINRNRNGKSGELSPFADLRMAGGSSNEPMLGGQGFGETINLTNGNVIFEANQGPITVNQGSRSIGNAGIPTTGSGGFATNNVGLGTGQGAIFNVPGGQGAISGNATVCINGQCFGNTQGLGTPIGSVDQQQQTQGFKPIFDDQGMIKAMETLVEWFKFLGLPTGASVPGTGNFTSGAVGATPSGRGAFASSGVGAFAGQISMQGGQIVFDANQGDMELQTSTGAISIAGNGQAFAQAGNARAFAGGVGLLGGQDQATDQLTQLNRTMNEVSGSLQAVGNSMASLGNEVVQGNQQLQQTLVSPGGQQNISGGQPVVFQGQGNVGFQQFPGGGAVGAGGAAGNPLGFLSQTFGQLGLQLPAGIPSSGGTVSPGTGIGTGGTGSIGTGTGSCSVCGAASGLGNTASDLSGAAGQLGNALGQLPTGGMGTGIPTTNSGFPSGGGMGTTPNTGTQPGTGSGCSCSCMPMDSDPNRYKIEDGSGNDCNNHIYFNTIAECHSRLNEICPGENTNNPTPANPTPTTPPQNTTGGNNMFPPGVSVSGPGAVACVNGQCFGSNGLIGGGQQIPGQIPGQTPSIPIGNPPAPPRIVQQAGLPSQAPDVNQDPSKWTIVESAGLEGTYDIIDDSGDVVQLGFRTLRDAETYLNYFVSYYEWVKSGSTGIPGPTPIGMGTIGSGTGIGAGISAGTGGGVQAIAGGGGAFAQAGNAIAQAGNFLGNALGFGSGKSTGQKKIGSVPLLESIPRAQGPFRSGQDNMEPIYDNSGVKIGASRGTPLGIGETTSQDEHEYGKKPRVKSRIQRHLNTTLAIAGDRPEWVDAFLSAFEKMFGDLMINLTVNNMLDGYAINQSQKKYQVKKVSVYN